MRTLSTRKWWIWNKFKKFLLVKKRSLQGCINSIFSNIQPCKSVESRSSTWPIIRDSNRFWRSSSWFIGLSRNTSMRLWKCWKISWLKENKKALWEQFQLNKTKYKRSPWNKIKKKIRSFLSLFSRKMSLKRRNKSWKTLWKKSRTILM